MFRIVAVNAVKLREFRFRRVCRRVEAHLSSASMSTILGGRVPAASGWLPATASHDGALAIKIVSVTILWNRSRKTVWQPVCLVLRD